MKTFLKMAAPAFFFAAVVGLTTIGCGDDTTSSGPPQDLSVGASADLSKTTTPVVDMADHD